MNIPNWLRPGNTVWVVAHHHTWNARDNNTYFPAPAIVQSVGTRTVHFFDGPDKDLEEVYETKEACETACPEPHMDE